jgi:branched-chain amino acid transport system ATP-binding protein
MTEDISVNVARPTEWGTASAGGLEIHELHAGYGRMEILHGINMHAPSGEVTLVLGANGSGKSTLAMAIMGAVRRYSGSIAFEGCSLHKRSTSSIANNGIAIMPEGRGLFSELSVLENLYVALYSQRRKIPKADRKRMVDEALRWFPVLELRRNSRVGALSGGQQQMVALARAFVRQQRFVILDEPSAGLAPKVLREVLAIVSELCRTRGIGVLLVEQSTLALEMGIGSKIVLLAGGRIVKDVAAVEITHQDIDDAYFRS